MFTTKGMISYFSNISKMQIIPNNYKDRTERKTKISSKVSKVISYMKSREVIRKFNQRPNEKIEKYDYIIDIEKFNNLTPLKWTNPLKNKNPFYK